MLQVRPWRLDTGVPVAAGPAVTPRDWQFNDLLSEPGSGSVTFGRNDPIIGQLGMDGQDLLQFLVDGEPVWVMVPDPAKIVMKSRTEKAGQTVTLDGQGLLGLLDRMKVAPNGGYNRKPKQTDRGFGWMSPDYDISSLDTAKVILLVAYAKLTWAGGGITGTIGWAPDYPPELDYFALIYWADNPGGNTSNYLTADPGYCWFFRDQDFPVDGLYRFAGVVDDWMQVLLDGESVLTAEGYGSTVNGQIEVTAGTHRVVVYARNGTGTVLDFLPGAYVGPGGFSLQLAQETLIGPNWIAMEPTDWKVVAYEDAPPGVAPVSMLLTLLDENEAEGSLAISRSFTATDDTNSAPWDTNGEPVARISGSLLDVLRSIGEAEFAMSPDLENDGLLLHAYLPGTLGTPKVVPAKIEGAEAQRENQPVTELIGETDETWLRRRDEDAIAAYGRNVGVLSLGTQVSEAEAYRIMDAELAEFARQREEIGQTVYWRSGYPWVFPGDTVAGIEDSTGSTDTERLQSVSVSRDGDRMVVSWSFRDAVLGPEERQALTVWADA